MRSSRHCERYISQFPCFWATLVCCLYLSEYSSSYLFEKSRSSSRWGAVNDEDMKNESPARGRISMSSPSSVRRTDGRGPPYYETQIQLQIQILQISMSSPALVRLRDKAFGARVNLLRVFQSIFKVTRAWTEMTESTIRSSGSARASEHPLISPRLFLISHLFFSLSSIWEQKATLTFPGRSLIHLVRWKEFGGPVSL